MYIIAGLGNPTKKYEHTRHNIGFDVMDRIAGKYNIEMNQKKHKAICGTGYIGGQKVLLLKPQTFMNLSGASIRDAAEFYKIDPASELIIIYDDINLEPGQLRIRKKGSAGGHNGMKDIIANLGTQDFLRIRVGVGEKPAEYDLADYVLGHFGKEDRERIEEAIDHAADAVELLAEERIEEAMNLYNKKIENKKVEKKS